MKRIKYTNEQNQDRKKYAVHQSGGYNDFFQFYLRQVEYYSGIDIYDFLDGHEVPYTLLDIIESPENNIVEMLKKTIIINSIVDKPQVCLINFEGDSETEKYYDMYIPDIRLLVKIFDRETIDQDKKLDMFIHTNKSAFKFSNVKIFLLWKDIWRSDIEKLKLEGIEYQKRLNERNLSN